MNKKYREEEISDYYEKLLAKFKQDPNYELQLELGKLLLRHIDTFTIEERKRYDELIELLKNHSH